MIVACVRTGNKYPVDYVYKLKAMVARHLPIAHEFVCLTDDVKALRVNTRDIGHFNFPGWWGKMAVFEFAHQYRDRLIYFDLDTVICGDLKPIADLNVEFGICKNFTRAAGIETYPCRYGSCVMTFASGFGKEVFDQFMADKNRLMSSSYGDQQVIEQLHPSATLLQDALPDNYFLGYRDLTDSKPDGTSVVAFAGRSKPHNCDKEWIKNEWVL